MEAKLVVGLNPLQQDRYGHRFAEDVLLELKSYLKETKRALLMKLSAVFYVEPRVIFLASFAWQLQPLCW